MGGGRPGHNGVRPDPDGVSDLKVSCDSEACDHKAAIDDVCMKCPICGGVMIKKSDWKISILDVLGAILLISILLAALLLLLKSLTLPKAAITLVALTVLVVLVVTGGVRELGRPTVHTGSFSVAWLFTGLLFLIWAIIRYFIRFEISHICRCSICNYHEEK